MNKLIIEVRVNEYTMRDAGSPHIPYTPDEIAADAVACRAAGASIVHFHARTPEGAPEHDAGVYADCVSKIRAASDILVHPTLGYANLDATADERISHILAMAKNPVTAPHLAPLDMGSLNVDRYNPQARRFETTDFVYRNSTAALQHFAHSLRGTGVKPYLVCWNIGFLRYAQAFLDMGLIEEPAFFLLCLTDNAFIGGHPATMKGLQAFLDFLPEGRRIQWAALNFGGNLLPLAGAIIAGGGHISIGLGDYPYHELGQPTNADLVRRVVQIARDCGREIATPDEAKAMLGFSR